ncbi:MAG: hypothetical protein MMC23_004539 [Stictis urceolatum]|nr:hypothetical protein [Stictis urceolata]
MIVTADPLGDFNATSQILRYSALAREVTVPRIPSVASIVFKDGAIPSVSKSGRSSPDQHAMEGLEGEVSKLNDQVEILALRLAEETARRKEAEGAWQAASERLETLEVEVREECFSEMEGRIETERRRWMEALGEEADRNDAHLDAKLEILSRGIKVHEDTTATFGENAEVRELEGENADLRAQITRLERELQTRSPTKQRTSRANATPRVAKKLSEPPKLGSLGMDIQDDPFIMTKPDGKENEEADALGKLEQLVVAEEEAEKERDREREMKSAKTPVKSPKKKMRTLTPHRGVAPGVVDEDGGGLMGTP